MEDFTLVQIDKKNYPVRFGMAAMMTFTKITNKGMNEMSTMGENMNFEDGIALCYAGLKQGARKSGQPFKLALEDVADLFDEDQEAMIKIMEVFSQAYTVEETEESGNVSGVNTAPVKK